MLLHASAHRHKQAAAPPEGSTQPGRRGPTPEGQRRAEQVKGAAARLQGGFKNPPPEKSDPAAWSCGTHR